MSHYFNLKDLSTAAMSKESVDNLLTAMTQSGHQEYMQYAASSRNIEMAQDALDEAQSHQVALEHLRDHLDVNRGKIDKHTLKAVAIVVNHIQNRLGYDTRSTRKAIESIGHSRDDHQLAMEGLGDIIGSIISGIIAAIKKVIEYIVGFFKWLFRMEGSSGGGGGAIIIRSKEEVKVVSKPINPVPIDDKDKKAYERLRNNPGQISSDYYYSTSRSNFDVDHLLDKMGVKDHAPHLKQEAQDIISSFHAIESHKLFSMEKLTKGGIDVLERLLKGEQKSHDLAVDQVTDILESINGLLELTHLTKDLEMTDGELIDKKLEELAMLTKENVEKIVHTFKNKLSHGDHDQFEFSLPDERRAVIVELPKDSIPTFEKVKEGKYPIRTADVYFSHISEYIQKIQLSIVDRSAKYKDQKSVILISPEETVSSITTVFKEVDRSKVLQDLKDTEDMLEGLKYSSDKVTAGFLRVIERILKLKIKLITQVLSSISKDAHRLKLFLDTTERESKKIWSSELIIFLESKPPN